MEGSVVRTSRKHYSLEDVVRLLQRMDQHLDKGLTVELACREVAISPANVLQVAATL